MNQFRNRVYNSCRICELTLQQFTFSQLLPFRQRDLKHDCRHQTERIVLRNQSHGTESLFFWKLSKQHWGNIQFLWRICLSLETVTREESMSTKFPRIAFVVTATTDNWTANTSCNEIRTTFYNINLVAYRWAGKSARHDHGRSVLM